MPDAPDVLGSDFAYRRQLTDRYAEALAAFERGDPAARDAILASYDAIPRLPDAAGGAADHAA